VTLSVSRLLTLVAASVLAFDGAALAGFGWWTGRTLLTLFGVLCFLSSGLVLLYWRWYRRRVDDIAEMRRGLADDSREMRRFLSEK
jgi:hypothetical protein